MENYTGQGLAVYMYVWEKKYMVKAKFFFEKQKEILTCTTVSADIYRR